jgi:hypothetical protein
VRSRVSRGFGIFLVGAARMAASLRSTRFVAKRYSHPHRPKNRPREFAKLTIEFAENMSRPRRQHRGHLGDRNAEFDRLAPECVAGMADGCQAQSDISRVDVTECLSLHLDGHPLAHDDRLDRLDRDFLPIDREVPSVPTDLFAIGEATDDPDLTFVFPLVGLDA